MRYPVVLLDVGETLVGPRATFGAVYSDALARLDVEVDPAAAERGLRSVWAEIQDEIPAGTDRYRHFPGGEDEYWLRFARRTLERATGAPIADDLARRALDRIREAFRRPEAWRVYPDVRPALESLRRLGVRLGVVSNWDSRLPEVLAMLDLDGYFDAIGVSHHEGVEKPSPELFHRVLRRLGARPGDALHVGDVPELDLAGARAAGIDGVLIDRHGRTAGGNGVLSDLSSLPTLARVGLPGRGER